MNHNFYAPDDLIIIQGEHMKNLYFVHSGFVSIIHEQSATILARLRTYSYFWKIGFFKENAELHL